MLDPTAASNPAAPQDRFGALCAELDEYDHLPELTAAPVQPTHLVTSQNHEETLDESILAGLTLP